ncbi:MAG: TIM barrel protein [Actinobacteria bacterium]|nr:TIM barrel protein [Actinomycetota bacterium]
MTATREYSLAHLSMIAIPPAQLAAVASDAGYQYAGFRLTPSPSTGVDHHVLGDDRALEALRSAVDDAGIRVLDVEVIRMKDPSAVEVARPLLEAAQALGARFVIATVEDDDPVRRIDTLGRMAELAAEHGTGIAVEFMLFSAARDLGTCVDIVLAADAPNVVVLADSLHVERSGGHPDDLRLYPPHLFPYAQICGANGAGPAEDAEAARGEGVKARLMPDEGDLPVRAFIEALPAGAILSVESPLAGLSAPVDPLDLATAMLASARRAAGEST